MGLLGFNNTQLDNLLDQNDDDDEIVEEGFSPSFFVILEVDSEGEQAEMLDRFHKEGLKCKATQS